MRKAGGIIVLLFALILPARAWAKTLVLDGALQSRIKTVQEVTFDAPKEVRTLSFRFAVPGEFSSKTTSQGIEGLSVRFSPEPKAVSEETDRFGNRFRKARWEGLRENVKITISFTVNLKAELRPAESRAPFPLSDMPEDIKVFLAPTAMVQSEDEEIVALSRKITQTARTALEAVASVLNWVADNIKYTYNPPNYDALYTLETGKGNCQNLAHISMALLRAAGIPSRIVGGIAISRQWKVPLENGFLVQDMGQGGHAWMEVYFPDEGWLPYDPQQSRQFTSTRHIRQTHGLDSTDINDSWSAAPYLPEYGERIEASFLTDETDIRLVSQKDAPAVYIASNDFRARPVSAPPAVVTPPPAIEPPPALAPPLPAPPEKKGPLEFGNTDFPTLVNAYQAAGNEAVRILDKETAEYATSRHVYAQAFTAGEISLESVSLAMRKFGGDGTLFIDIVKDEGGRPGLSGLRSMPLPLSGIAKRPGYYWVDFTFARRGEPLPALKAGRYWIVLRHSGEAVMNWFYIPGNPYGDGDDTRSTVKGYKWEDLLNYDFVFKVKGTTK